MGERESGFIAASVDNNNFPEIMAQNDKLISINNCIKIGIYPTLL